MKTKIVIAVLCVLATLQAVNVARRSSVEVQAPTSATLARHYEHTERALQAIGEGTK